MGRFLVASEDQAGRPVLEKGGAYMKRVLGFGGLGVLRGLRGFWGLGVLRGFRGFGFSDK